MIRWRQTRVIDEDAAKFENKERRLVIVPKFWAEGESCGKNKRGKERVLRRLGWSDESEEDARRMGEARAAKAAERMAGGANEPPNGFRVLCTHGEAEAISEETRAFFDEIGADQAYARLCAAQRCFRARVSPKPWRAGWRAPASDESWLKGKKEKREAWLEEYERKSRNFSSCRFAGSLGEAKESALLLDIARWHDEMSGSLTSKPLA